MVVYDSIFMLSGRPTLNTINCILFFVYNVYMGLHRCNIHVLSRKSQSRQYNCPISAIFGA